MGEVAEQSEVGGGACISQPPQSLRDSRLRAAPSQL